MAVDARCFPRHKILAVNLHRTWRLFGKVHCNSGMTVPALQRVVGFESRPLVLGQLQPLFLELLTGVDRTKDMSPDLFGSLHLACDFVSPLMGHMAVRAACSHT